MDRSLGSLLDELSELDRRRRRLLDAIAEHPDAPHTETADETIRRLYNRRIDDSLAATRAIIASIRGERHLRVVGSDG